MGNVQRDIESAEVGEELGGRSDIDGNSRRPRVGALFPEDPYFGKPLAPHDEVAFPAVAGNGDRELVVEGKVKPNSFVGRDRAAELDQHHGMVGGVAIIGRNEGPRFRKISEALGGDRLDVDAAYLLRWIGVLYGADAAVGVGLVGEAGFRPKGIQIKVKGKAVERPPGEILVFQCLGGVEGLGVRIELGVDDVSNNALREGCAVG